MVQVANGAPITESYQEHIDLCLACRGCESACPSGVQYGKLVEAAVVGWNDEQKLIKPRAFVVLKSPEKASDALAHALQDHVKQTIAPYKFPRQIEFRAELPKTATGKLQRFKLRAEQ